MLAIFCNFATDLLLVFAVVAVTVFCVSPCTFPLVEFSARHFSDIPRFSVCVVAGTRGTRMRGRYPPA